MSLEKRKEKHLRYIPERSRTKVGDLNVRMPLQNGEVSSLKIRSVRVGRGSADGYATVSNGLISNLLAELDT